MRTYRIFTNDRGTKHGVPMYSCLMEAQARTAEEARGQCPPEYDEPNFAPAKAIRWPEIVQSDDEKEWLKKHVGKDI